MRVRLVSCATDAAYATQAFFQHEIEADGRTDDVMRIRQKQFVSSPEALAAAMLPRPLPACRLVQMVVKTTRLATTATRPMTNPTMKTVIRTLTQPTLI